MRLLLSQVLCAVRSQGIIFRAALVFRLSPFGLNPPLLLETMQRGIRRTLMDLQDFVRNLTNAWRDAPAVRALEREPPQNQEVEGALDKVGWLSHPGCPVDK